MILFKKIIRNCRDYGAGVLLQKCIINIMALVFVRRTYLIYKVDLRKVEIKEPDTIKNIIFRFISPDEITIINQIENMEDWLKGKIAAKLKQGDKCLVAIQNSIVVGFNFLGFSAIDIPLIKLFKPLRPDACFSVQITINPKFRGKGIGTNLRYAVFGAMKAAGFRWIYGGTQITNKANMALTRKVGFRALALATYTRVGWHQWLKIKRVRMI